MCEHGHGDIIEDVIVFLIGFLAVFQNCLGERLKLIESFRFEVQPLIDRFLNFCLFIEISLDLIGFTLLT